MKIVVITGASHGLGMALATAFKDHDWTVHGTGRSQRPDSLDEAVHYHQFNAADAAACEDFWNTLQSSHDDDVCLINNAGSYVSGGLATTPPELFNTQMQSVYFTSVYMTKALVTHVPAARIINIISSTAFLHDRSELAYSAAKTAQRQFFQTLQNEFPAEQYPITNIYPDYIATDKPNPEAVDPGELAGFIVEQAELAKSYYLRDVTVFPLKH